MSASRSNIYLVGHEMLQILGSKLPSNRQVLSVLFYNIRVVKLTFHESAKLTVEELLIFWKKARIPVRQDHHIVLKIQQLYEIWRKIQKNANRKDNPAQSQREDEFCSKLDDLFDVAHKDALNMMSIQEDKNFLLMQRQKNRPGCMLGVDKTLCHKEKRKLEKIENENKRKRKFEEELAQQGKIEIFLNYKLQKIYKQIYNRLVNNNRL